VIGGWFLTAVIAFTTAALFAVMMRTGGAVAISLLVVASAWQLYRSRVASHHRLKEAPAIANTAGDRP
jgi:hypothetical protein